MKTLFFILLLFSNLGFSQVIMPNKGFGEVTIGITYEDIIWILGFDGSRINKEGAPQIITAPADELGIPFDYVVNFRYIMDYPITSVYFRDNMVVLFVISSYPEYNQFICQDIETSAGLKFWESLDQAKKLYGPDPVKLNYQEGNITYYRYKDQGICLGVDNNQVRTISIYNASYK